MHHIRRGTGRPLLLIHGLGASSLTWEPVWEELSRHHEVIAVDLPGFGETPALGGEVTVATLADSLQAFIAEQRLQGVATVGSSLGARLALELARRRVTGATVALDPGGFWNRLERRMFATSVGASQRVMKALEPWMPRIAASAAARTALLGQFSAAPWRLSERLALREMCSLARSPSFTVALRDLLHGERQRGMIGGAARGPIAIGWGRRDRVTFARQALRAAEQFPDAEVHWFEHAGHFPHWDDPAETVRLILETVRCAPPVAAGA
jgi:pimeloyl-ACP methyl ester carboxylesterase